MSPLAHVAALFGFAAFAFVLARLPRRLFTEAAGGIAPSPRSELLLAALLFVAGAATFESGVGGEPAARLVFAGVIMVFAAVVNGDLRYLVIPDLYSLLIALAAFAGPLSPGLREAGLGAVICGGLLMVVAWVWKRRTAVEGLGFGDVKLAAAMGALLGPERGLWAITVSAAGGAVLGFLLQALARRREGPMLFPYGVPLALAGAGFLIWRLK